MKRLLAVALLACSVVHAEPLMVEIDVQNMCQVNPTGHKLSRSWTNTTGVPMSIARIEYDITGADSLLGEFGMWLGADDHRGGLGSYGAEVYEKPSQRLGRVDTYPVDARFTIAPAETVTLVTACGPLNGIGWHQFYYWAVVQLMLVPSPLN